jgi:hypothetical protein
MRGCEIACEIVADETRKLWILRSAACLQAKQLACALRPLISQEVIMRRFSGIVIGSVFMVGAAAQCLAASRDHRMNHTVQSAAEENRLAFLGRDNIKESERVLREGGYNPGPIDGVVNDQTRQAVGDFQRRNRLNVTGVLDDQTIDKLAERGAMYTGALSAMRDSQMSDEYYE